jgi:hypothetical protein
VKLFAYPPPPAWKVPCGGLDVMISRYGSARNAVWDDVDPEEADYIIVPFAFKVRVPRNGELIDENGSNLMIPGILRHFAPDPASERALRKRIVRTFLDAFPLHAKFPDKHVYIDNGDLDRPWPVPPGSVVFKTNPTYQFPGVLPIAQTVPDPGEPSPIAVADLDVSFIGAIYRRPIRDRLALWSSRQTRLSVEFRSIDTSLHGTPVDRRSEMVREAFDLMLRSRFVLSPRGLGPTSRRFFEILAHGRIPILVSDSARLPLESAIDYDRFVVRVPEGFVGLIADYVEDFLWRNDLDSASRLARQTYLDYFAPQSFRRFVEVSLATRRATQPAGP